MMATLARYAVGSRICISLMATLSRGACRGVGESNSVATVGISAAETTHNVDIRIDRTAAGRRIRVGGGQTGVDGARVVVFQLSPCRHC